MCGFPPYRRAYSALGRRPTRLCQRGPHIEGKPVADLVPHLRADIVFGRLAGRLEYDAEHFDDTDSDLNALFGIE